MHRLYLILPVSPNGLRCLQLPTFPKLSAQSHETANGLNELRRVKAHTIFKHSFYFFDVIYFRGGVAINDNEISLLANS